jgi:hypothetical protein
MYYFTEALSTRCLELVERVNNIPAPLVGMADALSVIDNVMYEYEERGEIYCKTYKMYRKMWRKCERVFYRALKAYDA